MQDGRQTLDVVVRDQDRLSLALSATQLGERLVLVGTLIDTGFREPTSTVVEVDYPAALLEGVHIPRQAKWTIEIDGQELGFSWVVESVERPNHYMLQDAHVTSDLGALRAFAIEDLAATVGIGLAAGITVVQIWLNENRLEKARKEARERWQECLDHGGKPSWGFGVKGDVSLDGGSSPRFRAQSVYQVTCD